MATTSSEKKTEHKLAGRLTENTDPRLDATVREKLVTARIGLLLRAPFLATLLLVLNWLMPIAGWALRPQTVVVFITTPNL